MDDVDGMCLASMIRIYGCVISVYGVVRILWDMVVVIHKRNVV